MVETGDIQDLKQILQVTQKYFSIVNPPSKIKEHILKQLIDDSLYQLEQGINVSDIRFTYDDIYGKNWPGKPIKDPTSENIRRRVAEHVKQIDIYLKSNDSFKSYLKGHLPGATLSISDDGSIGGSKKEIFLVTSKNESQSFGNESDSLKYRATAFPKPSWLLKPLLKVDMGGGSRYYFLLVMILSFAFLFFTSIAVLYGFVSKVVTIISLVLISVPCFFFLRATYELGEKGITRIPEIALSLADENVLLTTSRNHETGYKLIELLQWEAQCPICSSKVLIDKGFRKDKGRYVGRCTLAPQEHVYTFDHLERLGSSSFTKKITIFLNLTL